MPWKKPEALEKQDAFRWQNAKLLLGLRVDQQVYRLVQPPYEGCNGIDARNILLDVFVA
jgi:hypothetical protein